MNLERQINTIKETLEEARKEFESDKSDFWKGRVSGLEAALYCLGDKEIVKRINDSVDKTLNGF